MISERLRRMLKALQQPLPEDERRQALVRAAEEALDALSSSERSDVLGLYCEACGTKLVTGSPCYCPAPLFGKATA